MRREAPERIFLATNSSEVKAVRGDVLEFTQFSSSQKQMEFSHQRVMLQQVPNHQHTLARRGQFNERLGIAGIKTNRFLDKHVFIRLQSFSGQLVMKNGRCGY